MSNFNSGTIYFGNLMKIENGISILHKQNICLVYEEKTDTFYSLENTLNYFLDLDLNQNLTDEQREEYKKIIKEHEYYYISKGQEGEIYIDINSIKILGNGEKNGNNRRK